MVCTVVNVREVHIGAEEIPTSREGREKWGTRTIICTRDICTRDLICARPDLFARLDSRVAVPAWGARGIFKFL